MIILALCTVLFGYLIWHIYNVNSNPRNSPKGPLSLPLIGSLYALGLEPHKKLMKLKNKYGAIFRIDFGGYRGIVLADPKVIKDAYALQAFTDRPTFEAVEGYRGKNYNVGLIWSRGKVYQEQKRFITKTLKTLGFGKSSMEGDMLEHLKGFFNFLDKHTDESIVNDHLFHVLSVQIVWRLVTGDNAKDEDEDFANAASIVNEMSECASSAGAILFFPSLCKLFSNLSGWKPFITSALKINDFVQKSVDSHKKSIPPHAEPENLIEAYIQKIQETTDEQSTFFGEEADKHLYATVGDLFVTGTETVATALRWYLLLIILHPKVQKKVQDEIDRIVGKNILPSLNDRQRLPYMECCILEVLRYSAFVPLGSPHVTSEDVNLHGHYIAKGTIVMTNLYGVLHDPDLWDEPYSFIPERFLNEDGLSIDRQKAQMCSFAFGSGRRNCIGEALARDEFFLFAAGLSQRYTFTEDSSKPKPTLETILGTALVPNPHYMIVNRR